MLCIYYYICHQNNCKSTFAPPCIHPLMAKGRKNISALTGVCASPRWLCSVLCSGVFPIAKQWHDKGQQRESWRSKVSSPLTLTFSHTTHSIQVKRSQSYVLASGRTSGTWRTSPSNQSSNMLLKNAWMLPPFGIWSLAHWDLKRMFTYLTLFGPWKTLDIPLPLKVGRVCIQTLWQFVASESAALQVGLREPQLHGKSEYFSSRKGRVTPQTLSIKVTTVESCREKMYHFLVVVPYVIFFHNFISGSSLIIWQKLVTYLYFIIMKAFLSSRKCTGYFIEECTASVCNL